MFLHSYFFPFNLLFYAYLSYSFILFALCTFYHLLIMFVFIFSFVVVLL